MVSVDSVVEEVGNVMSDIFLPPGHKKTVRVTFTDHDYDSGYYFIDFTNIHCVTVHPSGLVVTIESQYGMVTLYPMSRIRAVRVS